MRHGGSDLPSNYTVRPNLDTSFQLAYSYTVVYAQTDITGLSQVA